MKILLDECVDWRLKFEFGTHEAKSVQDMGWLGKTNGELLELASDEGFKVFVTIDKKLRYQLHLQGYALAIIILDHYRSTLAYLKPLVPKVLSILNTVKPGEVYEITASESP